MVSKNMVATAGEHYVCAELCRRNILALLTPKNNPLFDVLASDPEGRRTVAIQVKTMSLRNDQGWKVGVDLSIKRHNPNLFVVLVNMRPDGSNDFYVYEHDSISDRLDQLYADYIAKPKRDGTPRKDVSFRWIDLVRMADEDRARLNAWNLLGFHRNKDGHSIV
jgi:hypothetical protein